MNPYRNGRQQRSILEQRNGHVMAVCRDAEGHITYVCIRCGREQRPVTWWAPWAKDAPNRRTPDGTPLDPCPKGAVEGPWMDSDNYWRKVEP